MKKTFKKPAYTVVELLISLVLLSLLLGAIAAAVHAASTSLRENERIAAAMQEARGILNRMMREVRTADAAECTTTCLTITPPSELAPLQQIQYEYLDGALYMRRNVSGTISTSVLLGSDDAVTVSGFNLTRQTGLDDANELYTKNLTAKIELTNGGITYPFTSSATLRRNQSY